MNKIMVFLARRAKAIGMEDMLPAVVTFGLIAIVAAVIALVLSNFQIGQATTLYTCGAVGQGSPCNSLSTQPNFANAAVTIGANTLTYGLQGVSTMTSFLPLIALVIVAAIIIGIVLLAFAFGAKRGGERY